LQSTEELLTTNDLMRTNKKMSNKNMSSNNKSKNNKNGKKPFIKKNNNNQK
jgi:hypothetical protein